MKNLKQIIFAAFTLSLVIVTAQAQDIIKKPKLVVLIVVDQMRADYLTRYWDYFGQGGFKKLATQGANFTNAHFNYFPTYTAAGHAAISTGATPGVNGIVGNEWFDRIANRSMYCTEDTSVQTVGSSSKFGQMSPKNLLSTTIGDELQLATNFRSKVIGIALKDRAAILTSGHSANGAYWFDESTGDFITSTFYQQHLPAWVTAFNAKKLTDKYLSEPWETTFPLAKYLTTSTDDNVKYEAKFKGEDKPVFPHDMAAIRRNYNFGLIRNTPNGLKLTLELANAAIEGERLGLNNTTDLLTVSLSPTDYIGHQFGPRSVEVADTYAKLDQYLAVFISQLDNRLGKGNYLICLTADHGAADNVTYLQDRQLPGGRFPGKLKDSLNNFLNKKFGTEPVIAEANLQFYFNSSLIDKTKYTYNTIVEASKNYLERLPFVAHVYTKDEISIAANDNTTLSLLKNGYYYLRCGDLTLVLNPGWLETSVQTGTTHGSVYNYDTRVPLILYGWDIQSMNNNALVHVVDIASTITDLLQIQQPSGSQGTLLPIKKSNLLKTKNKY